MKFTLSWLKKFLDTNADLNEITNALTDIGLEVEEIMDRSLLLTPFIVAEILEATPHTNADKLQVCKVNTGSEELQIICGAPNARAGIKVILAKVGTIIPSGQFQIKAAEIRGVSSKGMLCSETELLIGSGNEGIAELPTEAIIGESFIKYYGLDDPVIEIAVTPNRADCLGVYGIARDLAARGIGKLCNNITSAPKLIASAKAGVDFKLPEGFNTVFATLELTGLANRESPDWLKLLLKNIGQKSISALVDITIYICHTFSTPLHAYDKDKLNSEIEVTDAIDGEKFQALNGKEYKLAQGDIVIRSKHGVEGLAGVIGGERSSCEITTQNIILESAIFNPISVANTGRRLHIDTDARHRFERHVDPSFVIPALEIASQMIIEICGGQIGELKVNGNINVNQRSLEFDIAALKQKTGMELSINEITEILKRLEFGVTHKNDNVLSLLIPSHRADVSIKEDIIEEIIRIHGYDKIPSVALSNRPVARVLSGKQRRERDTKRALASLGYDEVVTWSFMNSKKANDFTAVNLEFRLQNPISSELDYMRPSILPNLLEATRKNLARSIHDLAFFEVGPVFLKQAQDNEGEKTYITGTRCGVIGDKNPHNKPRNFDVFDAKADIDAMLGEIGISLDRCLITNDAPSYYHPTRSASILLGKIVLGYFGEVHPDILEGYDIKKPVIAFELDLETIPYGKLKYGNKGAFAAIDYQPVERDFAFVVDSDKPAGELLKTIRNVDKKLIKNVSLFDLYAGDKLENGKKSLAFSVTMQSEDRTLTDDEINNVSNQIVSAMDSKFGAALRG